jgi:hypothetical protein
LKYIETSSTPHTNDQQDPSDLLDSFLPSKQLQDTILTNAFRALLAMSASVEEAEIHGDVPRKALPVSYRKKHIWTRDRQVAASCYLFAPAKDAQSGGHRQGAEPRRIQKRGDAFSRFYRFGGGYTTILAG